MDDHYQIKSQRVGGYVEHYIELDCADPTSVDEWARSFKCQAKQINAHGPAGGAPIYRFTGAKADLERLVADYGEV